MGEKKPQWVKDLSRDRKIDAWIERVRTKHLKPEKVGKSEDMISKESRVQRAIKKLGIPEPTPGITAEQARAQEAENRGMKPGTIKKAIDFVSKKDDEFTEFDPKTGYWRKPGSVKVNDKAAMKTSLAPKIRQAKKMQKLEELINPRRFDKPMSKGE
jgi:hypothetical protein